MSREGINVCVRIRPFLQREIDSNDTNNDDWLLKSSLIQNKRTSKRFTFDLVFHQADSNRIVYDSAASNIVASALEGVNGTLIGYGQTSSGKTFTISSIMQQSFLDIFQHISTDQDRTYDITVSYFEVYNESIIDLADVNKNNLIINSNTGEVIGLTRQNVTCIADIISFQSIGVKNRKVGETRMNTESSRSHAIFQVNIKSIPNNNNDIIPSVNATTNLDTSILGLSINTTNNKASGTLNATINFVDLAGSERASKTEAKGLRLEEGSQINKSLLALGKVIRALSSRKEQPPYRESKLTSVLRHSLGGNCRTTVICCITLASSNFYETQSTLLFAENTKAVINTISTNEELDDKLLLTRLNVQYDHIRNQYRSVLLQIKQHLHLCEYNSNHSKLSSKSTSKSSSSSRSTTMSVLNCDDNDDNDTITTNQLNPINIEHFEAIAAQHGISLLSDVLGAVQNTTMNNNSNNSNNRNFTSSNTSLAPMTPTKTRPTTPSSSRLGLTPRSMLGSSRSRFFDENNHNNNNNNNNNNGGSNSNANFMLSTKKSRSNSNAISSNDYNADDSGPRGLYDPYVSLDHNKTATLHNNTNRNLVLVQPSHTAVQTDISALSMCINDINQVKKYQEQLERCDKDTNNTTNDTVASSEIINPNTSSNSKKRKSLPIDENEGEIDQNKNSNNIIDSMSDGNLRFELDDNDSSLLEVSFTANSLQSTHSASVSSKLQSENKHNTSIDDDNHTTVEHYTFPREIVVNSRQVLEKLAYHNSNLSQNTYLLQDTSKLDLDLENLLLSNGFTPTITYINQISSLQDSLNLLQQQYNQLCKQNEDLLHDYNQSTETAHTQTKSLEYAEERLAILDGQYNDLDKAYNAAKSSISQLELEKSSLIATKTQLQSELDTLRHELSRQMQRYTHESSHQQEETTMTITQLTAKIEILEQKLKSTVISRDEIDIAYKTLKVEFDTLCADIDDDNDEKETSLFELSKTIENLRKDHQIDREKLLTKHALQTQSFEGTIEELEIEIEELEHIKSEQLVKIQGLIDENCQNQLVLNELRLEHQQHDDAIIAKLRVDLDTKTSEIKQYEQQLDELKKKHGDSVHEMKEIQFELTKAKLQYETTISSLNNKELERKQIELQHQALLTKFERIEASLNDSKEQLKEYKGELKQRNKDFDIIKQKHLKEINLYSNQLKMIKDYHVMNENTNNNGDGENDTIIINAIDTFFTKINSLTNTDGSSGAGETTTPSSTLQFDDLSLDPLFSTTAIIGNAQAERNKKQQQYKNEIALLKEQLHTIKNENKTLERENHRLTMESTNLNEDLGILQSEETRLKKQVQSQQNIINKYQSELQTLSFSNSFNLTTLSTTSFSPILNNGTQIRNSILSPNIVSATPTLLLDHQSNQKNNNNDEFSSQLSFSFSSPQHSSISSLSSSSNSTNTNNDTISFSQTQVEAIRQRFKTEVDKVNDKLDRKSTKYDKVKKEYNDLMKRYQNLLESQSSLQQQVNQQQAQLHNQQSQQPQHMRGMTTRLMSQQQQQQPTQSFNNFHQPVRAHSSQIQNNDDFSFDLDSSLMDTMNLDKLLQDQFQTTNSVTIPGTATKQAKPRVGGSASRNNTNNNTNINNNTSTNNNNNNNSDYNKMKNSSFNLNLNTSSSMGTDDQDIIELTTSLTQRFPQHKMVNGHVNNNNNKTNNNIQTSNNNTNGHTQQLPTTIMSSHYDLRPRPTQRIQTNTSVPLFTANTTPSTTSNSATSNASLSTSNPPNIASPSKRFIPRITTTPSKALVMTNQMLGSNRPGALTLTRSTFNTNNNLYLNNRDENMNNNMNNADPSTMATRPFTRRSVRNFGPGGV